MCLKLGGSHPKKRCCRENDDEHPIWGPLFSHNPQKQAIKGSCKSHDIYIYNTDIKSGFCGDMVDSLVQENLGLVAIESDSQPQLRIGSGCWFHS